MIMNGSEATQLMRL